MSSRRSQQAIAGLAIVLVIGVTLLVGLFLAAAEAPSTAQRPTPTPFLIPTLEPTATRSRPTLSPAPVTIVPIPTSTPETPSPAVAEAASPTRPARTPTQPATPRSPAVCAPPPDWVPYTVQPGENLFRIGLRYGLTVAQMMQANCLPTERVSTGQVIYVPPSTPLASNTPAPATERPTQAATATADPPPDTPTSAPGPTSTQTSTDGACTNPDSVITAPRVGSVLSGIVTFSGTATLPDFSFYKLEIRREGSSEGYLTFFTGHSEVFNGILAEFDSRLWENGEYWIRLVVVNSTGNYPERFAILYTISN